MSSRERRATTKGPFRRRKALVAMLLLKRCGRTLETEAAPTRQHPQSGVRPGDPRASGWVCRLPRFRVPFSHLSPLRSQLARNYPPLPIPTLRCQHLRRTTCRSACQAPSTQREPTRVSLPSRHLSPYVSPHAIASSRHSSTAELGARALPGADTRSRHRRCFTAHAFK